MKKTLSQDSRHEILFKLLFLVGLIFIALILLDKASLFIIIGSVVVALFYVFCRGYAWILLIIATPSLTLGRLINIPITGNWIYEARLAELILFFVAAVFILDIYFNNKLKKIKVNFLSVLLFIYALISIASIAYIIDFRFYIFGLKVVVFSFLAYWLALNLLNSRKKAQWFLHSLAASGIILSAQLFIKFYQTGWSSKFFFERNTILVPIGPVATSAAILAFLTPILLAFYIKEENKKIKLLIFTAFAMSFLAVFLTLGKAAIVSLFIGLLYLIFKSKSKIPFVLFSLWFIILAYFAFNPYLTGLFERIRTTFIDVNTEFRLKEYKTGWEIINEHPLLGVGAGQQLVYFKQKLDLETGQQVNNYFLQPFIDLGAIGLALAAGIFLSVFKKSFKILKNNKKNILAVGFFASLIVAGLNGLAEVTFYALPYAIIFWLTFGTFENLNNNANPRINANIANCE